MKLAQCLGAFMVAAGLTSVSMAQTAYPSKPVKVVVGYAAGGAVDVVARTIGQSLSSSLGQPFVIENKPGAGTNIAVKSVITAEPDGHTLMMAANALAANMSLYQPAPFDAEKDLVAVSLVGRVPVVIAANPNVPYASIKQMIDAAKGKTNSIAYGSPGNGSTPHMAIELFARAAGIDLQHIPYRGGGPMMTDMLGGTIKLMFINQDVALQHVKAGKLRPLAVSSAQRNPLYPEVPTIAESGYKGFEALSWSGLSAPKGVPQPILDKLEATMAQIMQSPAIKQRMESQGFVVPVQGSKPYAEFVKSEEARWTKVIKTAGIKMP